MPDCPARTNVALAAWISAFGRLEVQLFAADPARSDRLARQYARRFAPPMSAKSSPRWSPRGFTTLAS